MINDLDVRSRARAEIFRHQALLWLLQEERHNVCFMTDINVRIDNGIKPRPRRMDQPLCDIVITAR